MAQEQFIPDDVKIPSGGGNQFFKLVQGDNRIRILSSGIIEGFEAWYYDADGKEKPLRKQGKVMIGGNDAQGLRLKDSAQKYFWLFLIYNYKEERCQAWVLTQKTIMEELRNYAKHKDFGHPQGYDITINRQGESLSTEYKVVASPPSKIADDVMKSILEIKGKVDLMRIFAGEFPFDEEHSSDQQAQQAVQGQGGQPGQSNFEKLADSVSQPGTDATDDLPF